MTVKSGTKARDDLTPKQRRLVREIEETAWLLKINYQDIKSYESDSRTPLLEMMRRKLIISEVVTRYTLVGEYLNLRLCHYYFGQKRGFIRLWKTKRFKLFNYHVIEQLSLLEKLGFVDSIEKIHKSIAERCPTPQRASKWACARLLPRKP